MIQHRKAHIFCSCDWISIIVVSHDLGSCMASCPRADQGDHKVCRTCPACSKQESAGGMHPVSSTLAAKMDALRSSLFLTSRCAVILSKTSRLTGSILRPLNPRATAEVDIQVLKLQETKTQRHVVSRKLRDTGCPMCSGRMFCHCQSVAELRPDLLKQWDHERNRGINSGTLGCFTHTKVSWVCEAHGQWTASISSRAAMGTGYQICAQEEQRGRSRPKRGLVKDELPNVWRQIHPSKFEGIKVSSLTCGSMKRLIWLCQEYKESRPEGCMCEHAWEAFVRGRCAKVKHRQSGCPFCSGRAVCECLSIAKLQPELMQYWCFSLNPELDPKAVGLESNKRAWWEHVCVDSKLHRRHLVVTAVVSCFEQTGRFPCKDCAGKLRSGMHHGRLVERN